MTTLQDFFTKTCRPNIPKSCNLDSLLTIAMRDYEWRLEQHTRAKQWFLDAQLQQPNTARSRLASLYYDITETKLVEADGTISAILGIWTEQPMIEE